MQRLTLLLLLTLSWSIAAAQATADDEELEVRRYAVEILIFRYAEDVSVGTEIFPPDSPPDEAAIGFDTDVEFPDGDEETEPPQLRELELLLLDEDAYTMDDVIRRFERLDAYQPMMHVGWTQATYPQDETPTIELRTLGRPPYGVDGSFVLYLGRYLHLVVDLTLDEPPGVRQPIAGERRARSFGDNRRRNAIDAYGEPGPVRYRIQENRIFKNGETRYFDHPKFGVLAKVTRIEDDETEGGPDDANAERLVGRTSQ